MGNAQQARKQHHPSGPDDEGFDGDLKRPKVGGRGETDFEPMESMVCLYLLCELVSMSE